MKSITLIPLALLAVITLSSCSTTPDELSVQTPSATPSATTKTNGVTSSSLPDSFPDVPLLDKKIIVESYEAGFNTASQLTWSVAIEGSIEDRESIIASYEAKGFTIKNVYDTETEPNAIVMEFENNEYTVSVYGESTTRFSPTYSYSYYIVQLEVN